MTTTHTLPTAGADIVYDVRGSSSRGRSSTASVCTVRRA